MGYSGKLEERIIAQKLRSKGLSYNEILLQVKVSKDTLSRWCRDIVLTDEQRNRLITTKINGQKKGSLAAAENKRSYRINKTQQIFLHAKNELGAISERDRLLAGIAIYLGEGDKADGKGGIANSDPRIIEFMMGWLRQFAKVPEDRFRGALWIHEGLDIEAAREFWSQLTGISKAKFHKTYIVKNKIDSQKIRKNIHSYGVFSIRFSCSDIQRQIMGWISAVFGDRIQDASCLKHGKS